MKYVFCFTAVLLSSASFAMDSPDLFHMMDVETDVRKSISSVPSVATESDELVGYDRLHMRALKKFIKENFTQNDKLENGFYPFKRQMRFCEAEKRFEEYTHSYPYDNELQAIFGQFYLDEFKRRLISDGFVNGLERLFGKGIDRLSKAIVQEHYDRDQAEIRQPKNFCLYAGLYLQGLSMLGEPGKGPEACIADILNFFNPNAGKILAPSAKRFQNSRCETSPGQFISSCYNLFYFLPVSEEEDYPYRHEALFLYITSRLKNERGEEGNCLIRLLSKNLYDSLELRCPPSVLITYADYFLYPRSRKKALDLCKGVLCEKDSDPDHLLPAHILSPDNTLFVGSNYRFFGTLLFDFKHYEAAAQAFIFAAQLENSREKVRSQWNLCLAKMLYGQILDDDLLGIMEKIFNFSPEERKEHYLDLPAEMVKHNYQYALHKAGKEEKFTNLLLALQDQAIKEAEKKKNQQLVQQAKRGREIQQASQILSQPVLKNATPSQKQCKRVESSHTAPTYPEDNPFYKDALKEREAEKARRAEERKRHENQSNQKKLEPKKEQNNSNQPAISPPLREDVVLILKPLSYIENLTSNKTAQDTFYDFFSPFWEREPKTDNQIQISLRRTDCLFVALALNQVDAPDASKRTSKKGLKSGTGSHKKGDIKGDQSDMEKQVCTFTKTTYIKAYQVKQTREKFIDGGIVPNDPYIIERLKETYPDKLFFSPL